MTWKCIYTAAYPSRDQISSNCTRKRLRQEYLNLLMECLSHLRFGRMKTDVSRFLLAQLHFDTIKSKMTLKQIKNALSTLSSGLDAYTQAYDSAMKRIKAQDPDASKLAMDTLRWVTHAKRRLSTQELRQALAVEPGTRELDRDNIPRINDMVSVCAGLVTSDGSRIRLVHYTTQDYFERNWTSWFTDS